VQLPLPKHIDEEKVIYGHRSVKGCGCFSSGKCGKLMIGNPDFLPCTPAGVMELIKESGIDITGKECVVVGRSNIVGKPMAMLLLAQNGTVTVCHSRTQNIDEVCKEPIYLL